MHWSNGTTFHGEWLHGAPYGLGEQSDSSQSTLRGCFGEAGVSGPGERTFMVTLDGQDSDDNNASQVNKYVYKGDMIDNKNAWQWKAVMAGRTNLRGEFRADAIEGQGTMIWPAGGPAFPSWNGPKSENKVEHENNEYVPRALSKWIVLWRRHIKVC